eukprot:Lankesteria_metandrocarpae@DN5264_c0_g2_i3.p1
MLLEGKRCLITGASRGVGAAISRIYSTEGARVILTGRNEEALKKVADECKKLGAAEVQVKVVDFTSSEAVQRLGEELAASGGVDVLVNNAGVVKRGNCLEGDPDEWEAMLAVNVNAPMRLTRILAPKMKENRTGVIINISSIVGLEPMESSPAYCASKFALRGWSLSCYESLRDHNVKVMLVNPGPTNTDMMSAVPGVKTDQIIQPQDVAEVALLPFKTSVACCPVEITLRAPNLRRVT